MTRCLYCGATIPAERAAKLLRGRRPNYCSDDHHERDIAHERRVKTAIRRAMGHK